MLLLKIICSNVFVLIQQCFGEDLAINVKDKGFFSDKRLYYEYEPARLQWHAVHRLCRQRSGALAVLSSDGENSTLASFLQFMNISEPVWITRTAPEITGTPDLILNFQGQSASQSARLLHKFSNMTAVTICAHLQFSQTCNGSSTVFSYSIHSFINEFQLRAIIMPGKPVQLALVVHGQHGPYLSAFKNDGFWHSMCVSWTGDHGTWAILVDGKEVGHGTSLYSSHHIGGNGIFNIGHRQDMFDSFFNSEEAFCGSITQLHIWDQVLDSSKIQAMEKECSLNPAGLIFRWTKSDLELTPNLQTSWGYNQCQELSQESNNDSCMTYDPSSGHYKVDNCGTLRAGVCQFNKDPLDNLGLSPFPKTPFFEQISEDLLAKPELEEHNSSLVTDNGIAWLSLFAESVVRVIESNPDLITSLDLVYLIQTIELVSQIHSINVSVEVIRTMASSYLNLASALIDPFMVSQWLDLKLRRLQLRPLMVIESIEQLLWVLADAFFTEKKTFTLSTRNLEIHIEPRILSHVSCSCVYKPQASPSNSQDEILIPETELQRLFSLGHLEVMFIHTYYGHLLDLLSRIEHEHQTFGHLATAVISATVRDVSRAKNVPVSVQYTLSTVKVAEYSNVITPTCVFWNVDMMDDNLTDWSDKGCSVMHSRPNATTCFCNHTTNFAVLMNYLNNKWSAADENILTKLTFIGSGASLCALLVTLVLFTVLDIPKSDRTSVHRNLCISLTLAQIVLLCSGTAVNNKVACTLVAALLHLFFMAAFSWMLVEGLLLWSKVVAVNLTEDRHMKYYYLIGWGLPVLIVTITLASTSGKYSADGYCWLSVQNGIIWGFVGPVVFIIMVNVMVLTRVLIITISTAKRISVMKAGSSDPVDGVFEQIRAAVKAVMVLLPILGLNWLFGLLVPFSIIMAYVFIILNSLQGLFIFLIYGVYNTEVRSTVKRIKEKRKAQNFFTCGSSRPSSSITNCQLGSTPVPSTQGKYDFAANQSGSLSISSACTSYSSRS